MTTQKPISKSPISDACVGQGGCWQYGSTSAAVFGSAGRFSKSQPPRRVAFSAPSSLSQRATGSLLHTGKEKDPETGYSYFGARYLEHDLMTGWLSVDPMADKYPSISPYAYCAWNPVKLVDPEGEETEEEVTKYYNYKGYLLYETNDGLDVIVLVRNERELESDLRRMKSNNQIDSPMENKKLHEKYGTLDYHQKKESGENNSFISDIWTLYYKLGYNDGYNKHNTLLKRIIYAFISSLNDDPIDSSPSDMNGGYSCGVEDGKRARELGEIHLFKPIFKSTREKLKL